MNERDFLQLALYLIALVALTPVLGKFMARVFQGERTFLSPALGPVERLIYKLGGVDANREMTWLGYAGAMLAFKHPRLLAHTRAIDDPGEASICASIFTHLRKKIECDLAHPALIRTEPGIGYRLIAGD